MKEQIKRIIIDTMEKKSISKYRLQKDNVITIQGLNNFLLNDRTLSLTKVIEIFEYLGIEVNVIVK